MRIIIAVVIFFGAGVAYGLDELATINYQSHESLVQTLKEKAKAEAWPEAKILSETDMIPIGGQIVAWVPRPGRYVLMAEHDGEAFVDRHFVVTEADLADGFARLVLDLHQKPPHDFEAVVVGPDTIERCACTSEP